MKKKTPAIPATLAFARGLFTRGTDAFGPEEIDRVFGLKPGHIPPMPFTEAELTRARELDQYLVLQVEATSDGKPFTMARINQDLGNKLGDGKLLYDTDWYAEESFYTTGTPRPGWALVSREVIPGSAAADYFGQTQALADYLVRGVYNGEKLPTEYQAAVAEWNSRKEELEKLCGIDWNKCAEGLAGLKLNILFREKPVEALYGLVVQYEVNRERLLEAMYTTTNQRSSDGNLVPVGSCGSEGVGVRSDWPGFSSSYLGVRFFRQAVSSTVR